MIIIVIMIKIIKTAQGTETYIMISSLSGGVCGCFDEVDDVVVELNVEFNVVIKEEDVFFVVDDVVFVTFEVVIKIVVAVSVDVVVDFVVVVVVDVNVDVVVIGVVVVEEVEVVVKVFVVVVVAVVVVVVGVAVVGVKIFKKIHCTKS